MPSLGIVERVPLPSLQNYVLISLAALGSTVLFSWSHAQDFMMEALNSTKNLTEDELNLLYDTLTFDEYKQCLTLAITSQLWTVLSLINICYCCMIVLGKGIQLVMFGELRVSEVQQLRERFWNFAFYKFIFIFGVLNVQYMNEAFLWIAWFSLLCSLQMLAQLCTYRFEYLACSPATPKSQHIKLVSLLALVFLVSFCLLAAAVLTGFYTDFNVSLFMMAECLLLIARAVYVIIKYAVYLVDMNHDGLWETRGTITYYTDLTYELSALFIDFVHYLHMVIWSNTFFSMASIVIWMQLRYLFSELQKRVTRHRNYLKIVKSMEARFAEATEADIQEFDDNCAICWDKMQKARKLPCGHMFHNPCLRSWLAQDISCPTCRISLSEQKTEDITPSHPEEEGAEVVPHHVMDRAEVRRLNRTNRLFHFDASRYVSWLPSFSVEVTHTHVNDAQGQGQNTQLDAMAAEVQRVFPGFPLTSILDDLRTTHSVEITIDNILEGRVIILSNGDDEEESSSSSEYNSDDDSSISSYNSSMEQQQHDLQSNITPIYESSIAEEDDQRLRYRLSTAQLEQS